MTPNNKYSFDNVKVICTNAKGIARGNTITIYDINQDAVCSTSAVIRDIKVAIIANHASLNKSEVYVSRHEDALFNITINSGYSVKSNDINCDKDVETKFENETFSVLDVKEPVTCTLEAKANDYIVT